MLLFKSKVPDIPKLREKRDVRHLVDALSYEDRVNDPLKDIQGNAALALFHLHEPLPASAVEPLSGILGDATSLMGEHARPGHIDNSARRAAASLLGQIGAPATHALVKAVNDHDDGVKVLVIDALKNIGASAVAPVAALLGHQDWGVRSHAADTLGGMGLPESLGALGDALHNEQDHYVRNKVVVAISRIDGPTRLPLLIEALADPEKSVRDQAAFQLNRIGGPEAEQALARYRKTT